MENHILPFYFPSHLTHILQPLDVGIFRPWKHFHDLAIQAALRSLDFDYTITSFFRDITSIRKQTMKYHTIVNSFKDSGMWPVSAKEGLKRMRAYNNRRKRTSDELEDEDNNHQPELPMLKRQATELWDTSTVVRMLGDRDPTKFSDYSVGLFHKTMQDVDTHLQKAQLDTLEHGALQDKIRNEHKRRSTSRRSIHPGGKGAISVDVLRSSINQRNQKEATEGVRLAKVRLDRAIGKQRRKLLADGIQARKDEKARQARVEECEAKGDLPDLDDLIPIRQPDKNPTPTEAYLLTPVAYPGLQTALLEQEALLKHVQREQGVGDGEEVEINIGDVNGDREVPFIPDSTPPLPVYVDSSDVESDAGSIDSIQRNTNFVGFT
jgi:hypothetical protein